MFRCLYSKVILESNNVLIKRNYKEFTNLMGFSNPEESGKLSEEYNKRDFFTTFQSE